MIRPSVLALCALMTACSARSKDDRAQAATVRRVTLTNVRAASRALAPLLASSATRLRLEGGAYVARSTSLDDLDVRIGARNITVAVGPSRRTPIELSLLGARGGEVGVEDGHVVTTGVLTATDRVVSFYGAQVEEWLLLNDASAPRELRWSLRADHVERGTDGELLIKDDRGALQLRIARPFAIDGAGVRHELDLGWDGSVVTITLDPSITQYPVLVDPVVEVPIWTVAATGFDAFGTAMISGGMDYDRASGKTYLFVGRAGGTGGTEDRGMAEWTGTAWKSKAFGGGVPVYARTYPAIVAAQGKVFSFGGCSSTTSCNEGDFTWEPGGGFWSAAGSFPNTWRRAAVTVLGTTFASDRVVVVGGEDPAVIGDMPYGVSTGNPSGLMNNRFSYTTNPPNRYGAALAYDKSRNRVILTGGREQNGALYDDMWEYDASFVDVDTGNPWTKICPTSGGTPCPFKPRYAHAMTYDHARAKVLMYGGFDAAGARLDDTWQYDVSGWKAYCGVSASLPACAPGALADAPMAYDVPSGRTLMAGGSKTGGTLSDKTWSFHRRGGTCTAGTQCDTGYCVDGTCCESASCGTCEQCDLATSPGVCAKVPAGSKDVDSCTTTTSTCDGAGGCKLDNGQSCAATGATSCISGFCADGFCCNSACGGACDTCAKVKGASIDGTCAIIAAASKAAGEPSCAPFLCGGAAACPTTCAADGDCASGNYCAGDGTCKSKKALGAACAIATDCPAGGCSPCTTGFCVDGVCCDSMCTGTCNTCKASLKASAVEDGKCGPAADGVDPHNDCTDARTVTPTSCKTDGVCNGTGACRLYTNGTKCGATAITCTDNKASGEVCNGLGDCEASTAPTDCFPGLCTSTTGCTKKCTDDSGCAPTGAFCDTAKGECVKALLPGAACTVAAQCGSKFCVDGVCCNRPCAGQCEACDVEKGVCIPVLGEPRGARTKCATGDAENPCSAARCDGIEPSKCLGFATSAVSCRTKGCTAGVATLSAVCDGRGACPAVESKTCKPYICAGDTCKTSCAADTDCAEGSICSQQGECINAGICDGDHTVTSADGKDKTDCAPYRCSASGTCRASCASSDECAAGAICDPSSGAGRCVLAPPAEEDSGGCAMGRAGGASPLLFVAAALELLRRRRRISR